MKLGTARLSIRPFTEGDADFIVELLNDADWLRFIGDKQVRGRDDALRYLREGPLAMQARHGHALWCVEQRGSGRAIGMCGLVKRESLPEVDLGFAFLPAARGQGLAREAASAVLAHGFDSLGLQRIVAIADPDNHASARVLEAVGLRFERLMPPADAGGKALRLFAIDAGSRPGPDRIVAPQRSVAPARAAGAVFGIAGHSGMGKTTLLERLIPVLGARGLVVSLVKHSHKSVDIDRPGKDSYRLREAGCKEVLLLGDQRWALMHELRGAPEPPLPELLARLQHCDLVLIEGFKQGEFPKLEVWRPALGRPMLWPDWPGIAGIASDAPRQPSVDRSAAWLDLQDIESIADFVQAHALPAAPHARPD